MPPALSQILVLMRKDVLLELRRKDTVISTFFFGFLILVLFNFTFAPGQMTREARTELAPGLLWVAFSFAGVMSMTLIFDKERLNQSLDGLLLAPIAPWALYVSKLLSGLLVLLLVEGALLPVLIVIYNLTPDARLVLLGGPIALGTLGFLATGTLLSAITMRLSVRALLLPLLNFPLMIPVLIPAVEASRAVLGAHQEGTYANMMLFLTGVNVVYLTVAGVLFPFVLRET